MNTGTTALAFHDAGTTQNDVVEAEDHVSPPLHVGLEDRAAETIFTRSIVVTEPQSFDKFMGKIEKAPLNGLP